MLLDKDTLINNLIRDNKISSIRNYLINNNTIDEGIVYEYGFPYLCDEKMMSIIANRIDTLNVLNTYNITGSFVDLVIDSFIDDSEIISLLISKHSHILDVSQCNLLVKYSMYSELLASHQNSLNDDVILNLYKKGYLTEIDKSKLHLVVGAPLVEKPMESLTMEQIGVVAIVRTLTNEELEYVLNKILSSPDELFQKGYIEILMMTQQIPSKFLTEIVCGWKYTSGERWFVQMLRYQNLDDVLDYILDNYKLEYLALAELSKNTATSTNKLARLYDEYLDAITDIKQHNLPFLECHFS